MNNHIQETGVYDGSSGKTAGMGLPVPHADILSQVLTLIRLRGESVFTAQLQAPWSINFPRGAAHFYFVEEGHLQVKFVGGEVVMAHSGDMLLLPHGVGHVICDDPSTLPVDISSVIENHFSADNSLLRYGGQGSVTRIISGLFHFEGGSLAAIMTALPLVVHVPSQTGEIPDWLRALTHFVVKETHEAEPGSSLMISRLIDLLVIRTLRSWAASQIRPKSWVGALGDERIGRALSAIHAKPYHPWTLKELASLCAMSRSIFAERFTARIGESPLQYIKRLKLILAADMLANGELRVTQVAERIGYGSDAAFSRAYKAQFGYAPGKTKG